MFEVLTFTVVTRNTNEGSLKRVGLVGHVKDGVARNATKQDNSIPQAFRISSVIQSSNCSKDESMHSTGWAEKTSTFAALVEDDLLF